MLAISNVCYGGHHGPALASLSTYQHRGKESYPCFVGRDAGREVLDQQRAQEQSDRSTDMYRQSDRDLSG